MKHRPHAVNVSTLSAISGVPVAAITRYLSEGLLTIPGLQVNGGSPTEKGRRKGCRYWVPYDLLEHARQDVMALHERLVAEHRKQAATTASRARYAKLRGRKANGSDHAPFVSQEAAGAVLEALSADIAWVRQALAYLLGPDTIRLLEGPAPTEIRQESH